MIEIKAYRDDVEQVVCGVGLVGAGEARLGEELECTVGLALVHNLPALQQQH